MKLFESFIWRISSKSLGGLGFLPFVLEILVVIASNYIQKTTAKFLFSDQFGILSEIDLEWLLNYNFFSAESYGWLSRGELQTNISNTFLLTFLVYKFFLEYSLN